MGLDRDDSAAIRASLLERLLADWDRGRGELLELAIYQAAYPGYEDLVADEYARAQRARSAPGDRDGSVPPTTAGEPILSIGHYRVLAELGRGGQGVVYLAEDEKLQRRVALKVLHLAAGMSESALHRFRREAAIASKLDHPGICPVYEVGSDPGVLWIAMRLIEGETLARWIAGARNARAAGRQGGSHPEPVPGERAAPSTRAEIADAVHLIEQVARALHEAHEAGIVHRDIKPGNVLVTPGGEPVIVDFGLAHDAQSGSMPLTRTGERFGTPAYMSPEQVSGPQSLVDRRADVWALGAMLYECVTLRVPFDGPTPESLRADILTKEPRRPSRANPQVPRDLEVVIEKALEKDLRRRYPSALALADELARVRTHTPIAARRSGPGLRLLRWTQRNPTVASFVAVLAVALLVSLAMLVEIRARGQETAAALRETKALAIARAAAEARADDPRMALLLALRSVNATAPPLPDSIAEVHAALAAMHERRVFRHGGAVEMVRLSRDRSRLLTPSHDGLARIWDLAGTSGEPLVVFDEAGHRHSGWVQSAVYSPDEEHVLTASLDGHAKLWRSTGEFVRDLQHPDGVQTAEFHPADGRLVLTGCDDGFARVWTLDEDEPRLLIGPHRGEVRAHYASDGERILTYVRTLSWDRYVTDFAARLWTAEGRPVAELPHDQMILRARFSPDGEQVLTASADCTARLWDRDGEPVAVLEGHRDAVASVAFSSDGEHLATASFDHTARLWSRDGTFLHELRGHEGLVTSVAFSRPSPGYPVQLVVTGSEDQTLRVWTMSGRQVAVLRGHQDAQILWDVAFIPETFPPRLVSGSTDSTARVWELWFPELPVLIGDGSSVLRADISADGRIATGSADGGVRIFDADGRRTRELEALPSWIRWVEFSPDGSRLAAGGQGGVRVWDATSWTQVARADIPQRIHHVTFVPPRSDEVLSTRYGLPTLVTRVANGRTTEHPRATFDTPRFAPDGGQIVASVGWGSFALLTRDWTLRRFLLGPKVPSSYAAFAPRGGRIVIARSDGTMSLFDRDGQPLGATLAAPGLGVATAEFSPDGTRIVSAHSDGSTRLWGLEGELLATLDCHEAPQNGARFTPDGARILTWSKDGTAREWFARTEDLLEFARARDTRGLSRAEHQRYADLLDLEVEDAPSGSRIDPAREAWAWQKLAWDLIRPGRDSAEWRPLEALEAARKAVELAEDGSWTIVRTLGAAQLRCGDHRGAARILEDLDRRRVEAGLHRDGLDLAFLAMARFHLGRTADARATLEEARALLRPGIGRRPDSGAALREATELIEPDDRDD